MKLRKAIRTHIGSMITTIMFAVAGVAVAQTIGDQGAFVAVFGLFVGYPGLLFIVEIICDGVGVRLI